MPLFARSQSIPAQTAPTTSLYLPEGKARLILADLLRLPVVLDENRALRTANMARRAESAALRETIVAKDSVLLATERRLLVAKVLGRDAENRYARKNRLAKSRFWIIVGETALLLGGFVLAAQR